MSDRTLTPTSYIVLGLLDEQPGTPYELKARVAAGLGNFWTIQHAQLYSEPARLAEDGLLDEVREVEGRRRKTYSITAAGKKKLSDWLADTAVSDFAEVRDLSLLKTFLGANPKEIAAAQKVSHERRLKEWENLKVAVSGFDFPEGPMITLEAGLAYERAMVKFWTSLL